NGCRGFSQSRRLTSCAPRVATDKIERERTNCRVKQPAVIDVVVATPKLDENILNNVFGVGCRLHPLTGEQKQPGRNFRKAVPPILMAGDRLHDLFTVFTFKTPPSGDFVYEGEQNVPLSAARAESDRRANLDGRVPRDKLEA